MSGCAACRPVLSNYCSSDGLVGPHNRALVCFRGLGGRTQLWFPAFVPSGGFPVTDCVGSMRGPDGLVICSQSWCVFSWHLCLLVFPEDPDHWVLFSGWPASHCPHRQMNVPIPEANPPPAQNFLWAGPGSLTLLPAAPASVSPPSSPSLAFNVPSVSKRPCLAASGDTLRGARSTLVLVRTCGSLSKWAWSPQPGTSEVVPVGFSPSFAFYKINFSCTNTSLLLIIAPEAWKRWYRILASKWMTFKIQRLTNILLRISGRLEMPGNRFLLS